MVEYVIRRGEVLGTMCGLVLACVRVCVFMYVSVFVSGGLSSCVCVFVR